MASYLDKLITLDEEGTENLDTSFEAEQTQDITEVIDVDTNNDEINAEAVAIEEDLEAMQDGTEAVGELAEQESVNDELLESPGDISPEVAKATNDAFKVTLAGLAIDVRDTVYGNITYDSNRNEPIEVVRITNDGVKDFLSKIKEHIIAFFRTIKAKIQKLIAKMFIMFSDVSKKGEALHKQLKNKLERMKSKQTSKNRGAVIDVTKHETKRKIMDYMPLALMNNNGSVARSVEALHCTFARPSTLPATLTLAGAIVDYLMETINSSEGTGISGNFDPKTMVKAINAIVNKHTGNKGLYMALTALPFEIEAHDKNNYETTEGVIAAGIFSKNIQYYAFRIHEDADVLIPNILWGTTKIKQKEIDDINITDVTPDDIKSIINLAICIGKNSKGLCEGSYKHLSDTEKNIVKSLDKIGKDGDIKQSIIIKASSVARSLVASVTFKAVMEQAKAGRRVLALANYLYNQLDEDFKDAKKEDKRN